MEKDLEAIYFEQREKAKKPLKEFYHSLQNVYNEYETLLNGNVELLISNKKLANVIDDLKFRQRVAALTEVASSEALGTSRKCKLLSELSVDDEKGNMNGDSASTARKENMNDFSPLVLEDSTLKVSKYKSPPVSVKSSPVKMQYSPILSRGKRHIAKKRKILNKNTDNDDQINKELQNKNQNLKPVGNISKSPSVIHKYVRQDCLDKYEKFRRTSLQFENEAQVIDVSKENLDKSLDNGSSTIVRKNCIHFWSESLHNNDTSIKNINLESNESVSSSDDTYCSQAEVADDDNCMET